MPPRRWSVSGALSATAHPVLAMDDAVFLQSSIKEFSMNQDSQPVDNVPVTLINVFEVPTDHVEAFIAQWRERAALMRTKPGFLDARLHRALSAESRFQLVNVAHWASREAFQAAVDDPQFQAWVRTVIEDPQVPIAAHPALYQVAVAFPGPSADEELASETLAHHPR
jgi:heme oxygenase (mycobilin-producing)